MLPSAAKLFVLPCVWLFAGACLPALAQCRLPAIAPDAVNRLSAAELVEAGHYLRAVELLEPVVREQPKNGQALWLLSRAKSALGDMEVAMQLAEAALATDETVAAYHVQVAAVAGRMAQKASLLKQLGLARRVKKELEEAARLDPRNTDAQWGLMLFYYAAPSLLGGDKAKTEQIGQQMAKAVPDLGLYYEGRLAREMKDTVKEESFYRQSLQANPLLYDNAQALMEFYLDKHNLQNAELWACYTVHVDPTRAPGWSGLAKVYALKGCWTEAQALVAKYEEVNGRNLEPYFSVASAAMEMGEQMTIAEAFFRKYLSKPAEGNATSLAKAHWQLGLALEKMDKHPAAITELQTAVEMDSTLEAAKNDLKRLKR